GRAAAALRIRYHDGSIGHEGRAASSATRAAGSKGGLATAASEVATTTTGAGVASVVANGCPADSEFARATVCAGTAGAASAARDLCAAAAAKARIAPKGAIVACISDG